MNNQTNKQPNEKNICSSFNDELLLELPVPLVAPGATAFLMLFVFPFSFLFSLSFSSNYSSSSEPHKHGSVAPGSPSEGRTYSLAMYKKSKLNQKCCSWCLFYTVVLLAFCYCNYMMKISKLYQITWRLTYINHMELQTFKEKLLSQKNLLS